MEGKILIFGEKAINKNLFHKRKHLVAIDKVYIYRIVISNKDSYLMGYITSGGIKSCVKLCVKLS